MLRTEPACLKGVLHYFVNGQPRISPTPEIYGGNKALVKLPMVSWNTSIKADIYINIIYRFVRSMQIK